MSAKKARFPKIPLKAWLLLTAAVVLPVAIVNLSFLFFYSRSFLREGIKANNDNMLSAVTEKARNFQLYIRNLNSSAERLAEILASDRTDASEFATMLLEEDTRRSGVRFEYDPEFLADLTKGKYPEYPLENHFGLLSDGHVPENFCAHIYRNQSGEIKIEDASDSAYQYRDTFLLPKLLDRGCWIDPFWSKLVQSQICAYSVPFYYRGRFAGTVSVSYYALEMLKAESIDLNLHSAHGCLAVFVVADNGKILFNTNKGRRPTEGIYSLVPDNRETDLYPTIDKILSNTTGAVRTENWLDIRDADSAGVDIWTVFTPLQSGTDWVLAATFDEELVLKSLHRQVMIFWILGLLALLAVAGVMTIVSLYIYSPILTLSTISDQIARGDETVTAPERYTRRKTPLGRLARNFNSMITNLRTNVKTAGNELAKRKVLENELMVAQQIQKTLLPRRTLQNNLPGCELDAVLIPARYVAGDFYDFWRIDQRYVALLIGDVSGKGVSAALIMAATRATIRQLTGPEEMPGDILTQANHFLQENNDRYMFSTVFFAIFDSHTGLLHCTNAGHCPPAILKRDGSVESLIIKPDTVVGIFPNSEFHTTSITLSQGETVFLCTDGVFDASSESGERFERERFENRLRGNPNRPLADILAGVILSIENFSVRNKRDDITLIAFRRKNSDTESAK